MGIPMSLYTGAMAGARSAVMTITTAVIVIPSFIVSMSNPFNASRLFIDLRVLALIMGLIGSIGLTVFGIISAPFIAGYMAMKAMITYNRHEFQTDAPAPKRPYVMYDGDKYGFEDYMTTLLTNEAVNQQFSTGREAAKIIVIVDNMVATLNKKIAELNDAPLENPSASVTEAREILKDEGMDPAIRYLQNLAGKTTFENFESLMINAEVGIWNKIKARAYHSSIYHFAYQRGLNVKRASSSREFVEKVRVFTSTQISYFTSFNLTPNYKIAKVRAEGSETQEVTEFYNNGNIGVEDIKKHYASYTDQTMTNGAIRALTGCVRDTDAVTIGSFDDLRTSSITGETKYNIGDFNVSPTVVNVPKTDSMVSSSTKVTSTRALGFKYTGKKEGGDTDIIENGVGHHSSSTNSSPSSSASSTPKPKPVKETDYDDVITFCKDKGYTVMYEGESLRAKLEDKDEYKSKDHFMYFLPTKTVFVTTKEETSTSSIFPKFMDGDTQARFNSVKDDIVLNTVVSSVQIPATYIKNIGAGIVALTAVPFGVVLFTPLAVFYPLVLTIPMVTVETYNAIMEFRSLDEARLELLFKMIGAPLFYTLKGVAFSGYVLGKSSVATFKSAYNMLMQNGKYESPKIVDTYKHSWNKYANMYIPALATTISFVKAQSYRSSVDVSPSSITTSSFGITTASESSTQTIASLTAGNVVLTKTIASLTSEISQLTTDNLNTLNELNTTLALSSGGGDEETKVEEDEDMDMGFDLFDGASFITTASKTHSTVIANLLVRRSTLTLKVASLEVKRDALIVVNTKLTAKLAVAVAATGGEVDVGGGNEEEEVDFGGGGGFPSDDSSDY